jgi:hypothetical protein
MKINIFKKKKNFKKDNRELNPNPYWQFAVSGFFIIALLAFFFGYILFIQVNKEPVLSDTDDYKPIQTIKKERIERTLDYFSTREQKSSQILISPSPIIDPSL